MDAEVTIEEVHLRRPVCSECGPLEPLREAALSDAEALRREHLETVHGGPAPDGYDA